MTLSPHHSTAAPSACSSRSASAAQVSTGCAGPGPAGLGPRFSVPIELTNVASTILQLSWISPHASSSSSSEAGGCPLDVHLVEQSRRIYRDAIKSVQKQILEASSVSPSAQQYSHAFPWHKRRGILTNAQDDVLSTVPELSSALQKLAEARRRTNGGTTSARLALRPTDDSSTTSSPNRSKNRPTGSPRGVKRSLASIEEQPSSPTAQLAPQTATCTAAAAIGMYDRPIAIPTRPINVLCVDSTAASISANPAAKSQTTLISEYLSAVVLYNFALTHHLLAVHTCDLPLLARSADLYDMVLDVLKSDLDKLLDAYNRAGPNGQAIKVPNPLGGFGDPSSSTTAVGGSQEDPGGDRLLHQLQRLAHTAMGAALANSGLIYRSFGMEGDAGAIFSVLARLCDVQSRRALLGVQGVGANSNSAAAAPPVGPVAQQGSCHRPASPGDVQQAYTYAAAHRRQQRRSVHNEYDRADEESSWRAAFELYEAASAEEQMEGAWNHFFCAIFQLRPGTIAPGA